MSGTYQPTWADGRQQRAGERNSDDRYRAIRAHLQTAGGETFTALDLGAAGGYFSKRLVADFDCTVRAIESHPVITELTHPRVTVDHRRVGLGDLRNLPRHDVVLALSVLHHFADWARVWAALRACRAWVIAEVPHPDENWMTHSAARHALRALHDHVAADATEVLGRFERTGRNGVTYQRPMYLVPGTVRRVEGTAFTGSGSNSRMLPQFADGLAAQLGYQPLPGSLNLRLPHAIELGEPHVDWLGRNGRRTRDYQFWRAWIGDLPCHAMVPGARGHGPDVIELVAPCRLRDRYGLGDGGRLIVNIELGERRGR